MKKILVVDDDEEVLETTQLILEIGGYDVEALEDATLVFESTSTFEPDLILLDIVLGKYDGREICSQLKKHDDTKHIPILMMSGLYSEQEMEAASCAPDDFLTKPFKMDNLLEKIQNLLRKQEIRSRLDIN